MKSFSHFTLLFLSALFLFGCQKNKYKWNDKQVFRYNENANVTTLDPAFARNLARINVCNQLFNGLVQLNEQLETKPDIAKSWQLTTDMKKYTFTLRNDVYFHENICFDTPHKTRKVVASDFIYSFNRLKDPKVASPGSWVLDYAEKYTSVNDTTLVIELKKPFPAFLSLLSMKYCAVVPKEAVDFYGNKFRENPVGTGPFKFQAWEENTKLVLRKNKKYYEKDEKGAQLPYLEAVAITFLPDKQSEFLQFVQGNLDILKSLDNSYKDELLTPLGDLHPKYQERINLQKTPSLNTEYIGFYLDGENNTLQNINLRKAINYGFSRKKMITFLRNNLGYPANHGFIPKGIAGFNAQKGYYFDIDKAKAYLSEFTKETGIQHPSLTIGTTAEYAPICEFLQRELQKIGIEIKVEIMPSGTLRQKKRNGKIQLFRASWIADYPDAENFMIPYIKEKFAPSGPNYTHFHNETFEKLYQHSFAVKNISERKHIYEQMDSIIIQEAPVIPLYYDEVVRFEQKNIVGMSNNSQSFLFLKNVKKL